MLWIFLLQLVDMVRGSHEHCTRNACFTLHLDKVSFSDAQQNCEDNGGYLMTVRDREEEKLLHLLLSRIQGQPQDQTLRFWIGLKLHRGRCVSAERPLRGFQWVNNIEGSSYSNWAREPIPSCRERCVSISYGTTDSDLRWTDGRCKVAAFYICKFDFKGMCKALLLLGAGHVTYTPPFSSKPQKREMKYLPFGTYADILCGDQQSHYTVCRKTDSTFEWTDPGPFCSSGERSCNVNNGGCEGGCRQSDGEVLCSCGEGHHLDVDGLSCRMNDVCDGDPCEHECVVTQTGYTCRCPEGFQLHHNQHNCTDVDECPLLPCAAHLCVNTPGSYTCRCEQGYELVAGRCADVDECTWGPCDHSCVNTVGSFSCHCHQGSLLAPDGHSCLDVCVTDPCQHQCTDTEGRGADGRNCAQQATAESDTEDHSTVGNSTEDKSSDWLSGTTEGLQHQSPHTDPPIPDLLNVTSTGPEANASLAPSFLQTVKTRILVCVLGSVVPLILLTAIIVAITIFRGRRLKKEAKKTAAVDGYCWVPPGLDPRLEKLYDSIRTDDL